MKSSWEENLFGTKIKLKHLSENSLIKSKGEKFEWKYEINKVKCDGKWAEKDVSRVKENVDVSCQAKEQQGRSGIVKRSKEAVRWALFLKQKSDWKVSSKAP